MPSGVMGCCTADGGRSGNPGSVSTGARLDRPRGGARFGGDVTSTAEAGRDGGASAEPLCERPPEGDAVCTREGGGGGVAGFEASAPA